MPPLRMLAHNEQSETGKVIAPDTSGAGYAENRDYRPGIGSMNEAALIAIFTWMRAHPKADFQDFLEAVGDAMRRVEERPPDHQLRSLPLPKVVISEGVFEGDRGTILKWEPDMPDEPGVQRCLIQREDGKLLNFPRRLMRVSDTKRKTIGEAVR